MRERVKVARAIYWLRGSNLEMEYLAYKRKPTFEWFIEYRLFKRFTKL